MNIQEIQKLTKGEIAERANLKASYKWLVTKMSYKDFCKFTALSFCDQDRGYYFHYEYMVSEERDCKKTREDYLKYYMYKLVQNLMTDGVELS